MNMRHENIYYVVVDLFWTLQRIGQTMASYIKSRLVSPWTLRSPIGIEVKCKILSKKRSIRQTKFGSGWKEVCKINNLKEGDCCVFTIVPRETRLNEVSINAWWELRFCWCVGSTWNIFCALFLILFGSGQYKSFENMLITLTIVGVVGYFRHNNIAL